MVAALVHVCAMELNSVCLHAAVNRMSRGVIKMVIGPFGNQVVGPGFPFDIAPLVGEGKYNTLLPTELTTRMYEDNNQVNIVVTAVGFPHLVHNLLIGKENRKVLTKFFLTPNDCETGMHKIRDYGLLCGEGYAFDLNAWDESKHTLFAEVKVVALEPTLSFLPMFGPDEITLIKIQD